MNENEAYTIVKKEEYNRFDNTELGICVHYSYGSSFETKYGLTLLNRILVNTWKAEVTVTIMKPWLTQFHKERRKSTIFTQIRRKVHHRVTINDFVKRFSICYL